MEKPIESRARGTWVQTERRAHEAWDLLIKQNGTAARLMHRLVSLMDHRGAVVVSQKTLGEMLGVHRNTIGTSIRVLEAGNWIETIQIGGKTGGVRAYIVNRRVAWADKRENQRYATFDARIIASASEQSTESLQKTDDLIQLPRAGEFQLPHGETPPPSQPILPSMEPDLPATGDTHLQQELLGDRT